MAHFYLPAALRLCINQQHVIEITSNNFTQALQELVMQYPKLKSYLFSPEGQLNPFVNLYLNGQDVRYVKDEILSNLGTHDKIEILLSLAGG